MKALAQLMPAIPVNPRPGTPGPVKTPGKHPAKSPEQGPEGTPFIQVLQETPVKPELSTAGHKSEAVAGTGPMPQVSLEGIGSGTFPLIVAMDGQMLVPSSEPAVPGVPVVPSGLMGMAPEGGSLQPALTGIKNEPGLPLATPTPNTVGQATATVPAEVAVAATVPGAAELMPDTQAVTAESGKASQLQSGATASTEHTVAVKVEEDNPEATTKATLPLPGLKQIQPEPAQGTGVQSAATTQPAVEATAAEAPSGPETGNSTAAAADTATLETPYRPDPATMHSLANQATVQETVTAESVESATGIETTESQIDLGLAFNREMTAGTPGNTGIATHGQDKSVVYQQVRQQVLRQFAGDFQSAGGSEKVSIKLSPENLGSLEITFTAVDDQLKVAVEASGAEAESALRENLKDLTEAILDRTSRFQQVDIKVELRDGNEPRQDQKQNERQESRQEERRSAQDQAKKDRQNEQARRSGLQWARTWAEIPEEG